VRSPPSARLAPPPGRSAPLAARAAELAALRGPLRFALATLAARLVEREAWKRLGFARLGDNGRERLGHSSRSLYDLARCSRKLSGLPRLRSALVSGALSWTKARLLARVASGEDEAGWLQLAARLPADALEKQVRRVDRGALEAGAGLEALEELDEDGRPQRQETFWLRRCTPGAHGKWYRARQLANRVAGRTCAPPEVLEMVVAEVLSFVPLEDEPEAEPGPARAPSAAPRGAPACMRAPAGPDDAQPVAGVALPAAVAPLLQGLEGADALALDCRLRAVVALEQRLDARIGALLAEVARGRAHRLLGHRHLGAFARERLGVSPSKARALLRLERAGRLCPELRSAYGAGRLSWVKAQALLPLLEIEECSAFRARWLAWAGRVTLRRLEDDVAFSLALYVADPVAWARAGGLPDEARGPDGKDGRDGEDGPDAGRGSGEECQVRAEPTTLGRPPAARLAEPLTCRLFVSAPRGVTRLARAALCTVRRRIERLVGRPVSESEGFEAMLDHVLEAWGHPHTRVRREHRIFARDGWRCAVPGCSGYRNLHAHHLRFRSHGGPDAPENLITLCAFHHQRGVHSALLRVHGRAPDGLLFELPWGRYRVGDVRCTGLKGSVLEIVSSRPGPTEISSTGTSTSASTRSR
jgi:hypothetical protein